MNKSKVKLRIDLDYGLETESVCFDIENHSHQERVFEETLSLCRDGADVATRMLCAETPSDQKQYILDNRKRVAVVIANEMVDFLLEQMAAKDTMNGYKIV